MASELLKLQWQMTRMTARLIQHINDLGYECTWGDAYRDDRCAYGDPDSNHRARLAVDLNLFDGDRWVDGKKKGDWDIWMPIGFFWKSIGGCWGGDFTGKNANDLNHFSLEYNGHK